MKFLWQYGVFMEFCKHDSCGCGTEPNYDQLKLVSSAEIGSNEVHLFALYISSIHIDLPNLVST